MIAHLAEAQGLSEALQALVDLREGIGVRDEWDLLRLPASLRTELLTTGGGSEAELSQGLAALERRIEDSPPDQRDLL